MDSCKILLKPGTLVAHIQFSSLEFANCLLFTDFYMVFQMFFYLKSQTQYKCLKTALCKVLFALYGKWVLGLIEFLDFFSYYIFSYNISSLFSVWVLSYIQF